MIGLYGQGVLREEDRWHNLKSALARISRCCDGPARTPASPDPERDFAD